MLKLNHKKLTVWIKTTELISQIYFLTKDFPKEEIFGITNQLRRASVSIASNIAEGSARSSKLERRRFFEIARSSLVEVDAQIDIARKLGYIKNQNLADLETSINHTFALLSKMITNT